MPPRLPHVSTRRQAEEGISLDAQIDAIRAEALALGRDLKGIYEESASAWGPKSALRPELLAAIKHAALLGAPLIVWSIDRLSRDLGVVEVIERARVCVISVKEGRCDKKRLRALIKAAAEQSDEAAARAKGAAAASKVTGRGPGNRTNLNKVARTGTLNNMVRAGQKIRDLADVLEADPEMGHLTWRERANRLNAAGHLNRKSEARGEWIPWTAGSLRKPYRAALREIEDRKELDALPFDLTPPAVLVRNGAELSPPESTEGPVDAQVSRSAPLSLAQQSSGSVGQIGDPSCSSRTSAGTSPTWSPQSQGCLTPPIRRPLTDPEKKAIDHIMKVRNLTTKQVMDELGLRRLDASLWMAHRNGTTVSPDMLSRLNRWLQTNLGLL